MEHTRHPDVGHTVSTDLCHGTSTNIDPNPLIQAPLGWLWVWPPPAPSSGWRFTRRARATASRDRRPDSAPGRTARRARFGEYAVVGRTVTINRPRNEIYAYWRDFRNLARFVENVRDVSVEGDLTRWTIYGPLGRDVSLKSSDHRRPRERADRLALDREFRGRHRGQGHVSRGSRRPRHRGRGAYRLRPACGELGRWIAKHSRRSRPSRDVAS